MKTTFEIFEVLIDPDEVVGTQTLDCGAVRIEMADESAVIVPKAIFDIIKPDIDKAILKRLESAADAIVHILIMLGDAK